MQNYISIKDLSIFFSLSKDLFSNNSFFPECVNHSVAYVIWRE